MRNKVPSNCQRNFNLLAFDPDGDEVKCRYGNTTEECNPCTPPSVLSLSSTCTLSFSPTNSINEGPYAVQLMMEDFPRQQITLIQTRGSQVVKTINDPISKIPIQFVLRVDPVVPSCTEGLYLPKFLPPTPANRAQLYAPVNQTLEISINAEANNSTPNNNYTPTQPTHRDYNHYSFNNNYNQHYTNYDNNTSYNHQSLHDYTTFYNNNLHFNYHHRGHNPYNTTNYNSVPNNSYTNYHHHNYNSSLPNNSCTNYHHTSYNHYNYTTNYNSLHNNSYSPATTPVTNHHNYTPNYNSLPNNSCTNYHHTNYTTNYNNSLPNNSCTNYHHISYNHHNYTPNYNSAPNNSCTNYPHKLQTHQLHH
ncbi:hypothetical protein D5F01_LYC22899 [Larimichthys crocea]|uniref:Uncharacterized protein n=1 Tax=Larimichthys crocea TaxID=215358 RepID=A0A6G0HJP8_LARCR|nr:hypothetical protein D5F01_LYC22899 [Larimichthys crocea]